MRVYLNSFCPLCCTKAGREAVKIYKIDNYIDGSCRREPDFENDYPCITGLCRPGFSKKLEINDIIIYVTNIKGVGSRKIVAILKVQELFKNHKEAAKWYMDRNIKIPNNLMVKETTPFDLDKTHKQFKSDGISNESIIKVWNLQYIKRARLNPEVARCLIVKNYLYAPLELSIKEWEGISKRALCTQNPPILTEEEWTKFKEKIKSTIVL